mmetsp:Transcript_16803/g.52713  ORF Transcript_16803/g.52713 Transcript_16803/m.52713 type:complete len:140 (+) Transcript_16803:54-473(+)
MGVVVLPMGSTVSSSCQPALSRTSSSVSTQPCECKCPETQDVVTCGQRCPKDGLREVRDFHEFHAVQWSQQMGKKELSQAQHAVDRTLQRLVLGMAVGEGGTADGSRLFVTPDLRALEVGRTEGEVSDRPRRRMPLSQV